MFIGAVVEDREVWFEGVHSSLGPALFAVLAHCIHDVAEKHGP